MARFEYAQSAIEDVDTILAYTINKWGVAQAESYFDGLEKQAQLLADMPTLGKFYEPYKDKYFRVFPYEKHLIYYIEAPFGIILMHITHKTMDQERHISEGRNA